jgi:hypothetical protein
VRIGVSRREAVTDLGDGLDAECAAGILFGNGAEARHDAVNRILADDPAFPAQLGEVVLADDAALGAVKGNEQLHDARFEDRGRPSADNLTRRGPNFDVADRERLLMRKDDW